MKLLVNIDTPDVAVAERFYCQAFQLTPHRRFGLDAVELLGTDCAIYLLQKNSGSTASEFTEDTRRYERHWTPIHLDFVVTDLESAIERSLRAGATQEKNIRNAAWGRIALMADPFGHGYCLVEFSERGYDAIAT